MKFIGAINHNLLVDCTHKVLWESFCDQVKDDILINLLIEAENDSMILLSDRTTKLLGKYMRHNLYGLVGAQNTRT